MLATSVSFAWTFDDFLYFADSIKGEVSGFDPSINKIKAQETAIRNLIGNTNFTGFVCQGPNPNDGSCNLYCFDGPLRITSKSSTNLNFQFTTASTANRCVKINIYSSGNPSKNQWQSLSSFFIYPSNWGSYGLFETSNDWTDWTGCWFQNKYVAPYYGPVFTPVNNGYIPVTNSIGATYNFIRLPYYPYGQNDVTLGYITNYDGVYALNGYFGPYTYSSGDGNIVDGSLNTFNYNYYYGTYNHGLCFDSSTGRVYVNKNRLYNKQGFNLSLNYQLNLSDNDSTYFYEDGNYYSYIGYVFPSSGDLISQDLPDYTEINAFINSFGDFVNPDSEDEQNIDYMLNNTFNFSGNFLSGDFFSGDLLGNLGFDDDYLNNDYSVFVYRVYREFLSSMGSSDTNSYVTFSIHGHTYTYYANDFAVPNGPLKTFISMFLICILFMLLVYQLHFIIIALTTLDIFGLSRSFDQNHTIFM